MLVEKCEMAIWKKAGLSNHPVPEGKIMILQWIF